MSDTTTPTLGSPRPRGEETARKWRKRRSRFRRRLRRAGDVALVLLAISAIGFGYERAHSGGRSTTTTTAVPGSLDAKYPPMNDVKVAKCAYWPKYFKGGVVLHILNHTSTPWTYYIDVRWNDGTQKYSERTLHSKVVRPLHDIPMGGFSATAGRAKHLTCSVVSVARAPV